MIAEIQGFVRFHTGGHQEHCFQLDFTHRTNYLAWSELHYHGLHRLDYPDFTLISVDRCLPLSSTTPKAPLRLAPVIRDYYDVVVKSDLVQTTHHGVTCTAEWLFPTPAEFLKSLRGELANQRLVPTQFELIEFSKSVPLTR
jgi:hypothetical protein